MPPVVDKHPNLNNASCQPNNTKYEIQPNFKKDIVDQSVVLSVRPERLPEYYEFYVRASLVHSEWTNVAESSYAPCTSDSTRGTRIALTDKGIQLDISSHPAAPRKLPDSHQRVKYLQT